MPVQQRSITLSSLSFKINFIIFAVVITVGFSFVGYDYWKHKESEAVELREDLGKISERLCRSLSLPLWNFSIGEIESIVHAEMANKNIVYIEISGRFSKKINLQLGRSDSWDVSKMGASRPKSYFDKINNKILYNEKEIGSVRVYMTDHFALAESRQHAIESLKKIVGFLLVIIITLIVIIQKYVVRPITLLKEAVSATEAGQPISLSKTVRKDEIGQLTRSFISMRQHLFSLFSEREERIVELETARHNLKSSEEYLQALIDQSPIGLALCKMDGSLVTVNPAYADIIGYSIEETLRLSYWDITPEKYAPQEQEQLELLETTGHYGPYEKEYRHKEGHLVPVRLNGMILTRDNEKYIWSSVEDIAAIKQAEEEKDRLEDQLRQSQKMEAIGTLAGGVAHDFNNILAAILGYTELVLRNPDTHPKNRKKLEQVFAAAKRAKELVKQILMFSRKEKEHREYVKINSIVDETAQLLRNTIPTTVTINLDIETEVGSVLADSTQIHQVIMNLCTNAFHAMPNESGAINIGLKQVDVNNLMAAQYPNLRQGRYALLSVSDTGIGMPPEVIARIFEPFYTTKKQGEGTGMGLAVVHGIIQSHDGSIGVESTVGKGTTFKIFLPLAEGAADSEHTEGGTAKLQGVERVLFVDDEIMLAELGKETLESLGYKVTAMTSVEEALVKFNSNPKDFDLIITDQTMPEMTGDVFAKKALLTRPDVPIIICTGHSALIDADKVKAIGIKALLMKPVEGDVLAAEVRKALDGIAVL